MIPDIEVLCTILSAGTAMKTGVIQGHLKRNLKCNFYYFMNTSLYLMFILMYIKHVLCVYVLRGYKSCNNPLTQKTVLPLTVYLWYILTKCTITEVAYTIDV